MKVIQNEKRCKVWVAIGIIHNASHEVFICLRNHRQEQGGKWEFPGGKLEQGEDAQQALCRELQEEVGIHVQTSQPLIQIEHHYPTCHVLLDVWSVTDYTGQAHGKEGQQTRWCPCQELHRYDFPKGNQAIIKHLQQCTP